MSTALGLAMQISANTAQLATAVADVNKRLDSLGTAGKKAASDLGTLKTIEIGRLAIDGIQAATGAFLSLTNAVTGAVKSVTSFALSVGQELDALNDVANRTGVGVEALQAYARAAADTGVSVETFAKQIQKLTINIGQASLDDKEREKFEKLGITFENLKKQTPEKQFEQIVDSISRIADPAERAATAVQFFGKGGIELGELFTLGPGALTKMREEAISLGQVVDSDAVKAIDNMNDSFAAVQATIKGLVGTILGELAGPISTIAQELLGVIKQAGPQRIAEQVASGLLDFIKLAGNAFFQLAQFIEAFVTKYSSVLGVDVRSNEQKQRDALEQERKGLQAILDAGGETALRRLALGVRAVQPGDKQRLAEINGQLAALGPAGPNTIAEFRNSFNNAIDNAANTLQTKIAAEPGTREPNAAEKEQVAELKRIRQNTETGTVDILN
jgi:hypothetical protein